MQQCGLAAPFRKGRDLDPQIHVPRLLRCRTYGSVLELTVETRRGQTIEELNTAAPKLAASLRAATYRVRPAQGRRAGYSTVIELVMHDSLTAPVQAAAASPLPTYDKVTLGRGQSGATWQLVVRGRHTLIAGCSGAGKGSVLWGLCCGLSPAVRRDLVRLWGVDLKRGVELQMGAGLFSAAAYNPRDALAVLKSLLQVIDERGTKMAGHSRLHQPRPGDPLHVLVIDELAALTAYSDITIRRDAERLLSEILTQGRALGVVVVACVQDPRKDVVPMRGLFTQTVALRLRSIEETVMVLGEGAAAIAPAHRISPRAPGTAWIVDDTGAVDRVRADYWPDEVIAAVATTNRANVLVELPANDNLDDFAGDGEWDVVSPRRPRTPRKPREMSLVAPIGGDDE
ncbi:cell division protein FtsK [Nocardioides cavernaquae]|uniref:Cell division protein FtsK n=2 Tax=Nocardioides cavernaquae TaxID=2321396 RepID=A0A3A5HD75_9ACTN|nr:cell division protein FtsK [Nocardioides cavernaquae]